MSIPSHILKECIEAGVNLADGCLPWHDYARWAWKILAFSGIIPEGLHGPIEGNYYTTLIDLYSTGGTKTDVRKTKSDDPRDPYMEIEETWEGDTSGWVIQTDFSGAVDVDALRQSQWDYVRGFFRSYQDVPPVPHYGTHGGDWVDREGSLLGVHAVNLPEDFIWCDFCLTANLARWAPQGFAGKVLARVRHSGGKFMDEVISHTIDTIPLLRTRSPGAPRAPNYYYPAYEYGRVGKLVPGTYHNSESLPTGTLEFDVLFGLYRQPDKGHLWAATPHIHTSIPLAGWVEYWPSWALEADWGF